MRSKVWLLLIIPFLQACSWVEHFFIINTTNGPVTVEMKLLKNKSNHIFIYDWLSMYSVKHSKVDYSSGAVETKVDTLEDFSHFRLVIPAEKALCVGFLFNDHYKKHDQSFINGRAFNLEHILITKGGSKTEITTNTFDRYFEREKGDISYVLR